MLGMEHNDWESLTEHPVEDAMVLEDPETKEKTWYPPLATAKMNHPMNKAFMADWKGLVYHEEKVSLIEAHAQETHR